jgi:predicted amidohydrolase
MLLLERISLALVVFGSLCLSALAVDAPPGWITSSPRAEIQPEFRYEPNGGRDGKGALVIVADARDGLDGDWTRAFPVVGGKWYRFQAVRRIGNIALPRRSVVARVLWRGAKGKPVNYDGPVIAKDVDQTTVRAEPEYPEDGATDAHGWTEVSGTYRAPSGAQEAIVELGLRWAPRSRVEWSEVALAPAPQLPARTVRLAAVHYRPHGGKSPAENRAQFAPLIAEAAKQKADLVVLPEFLTNYDTGLSYADSAEPVPGPSTEYFGALAKQYNLYIVAGLIERDGSLIYNVAALVGPDGMMQGKYRKAALTASEIDAGVTPGREFPVFGTRFGKLGLMVCYDGYFPEVARELSLRGAEVIAWPVAGCNPLLAAARACDNQVYLVSSTYSDVKRQEMISGVFDREGKIMVQAKEWGGVAVAELDLNQPAHWSGMGDFRAELPRHRPAEPGSGQPPEPKAEIVSIQKIWDKAPHNGFTDLIRFKDQFFCCFREGEDHVGGDGVIRILASTDGDHWEECAGISEPGVDLREPKLEITPGGQQLYLLCGGAIYGGTKELKGRGTRCATSRDGRVWTATQKLLGEGDWLWRVASNPAEGKLYGMADNTYPTTSGPRPEAEWTLKTYRSGDGAEWQSLGAVQVTGQPSQPTIRFLRDGRAMALVRRNAGDRNGVIGVARAPYREWQWTTTGVRIAGPNFIELPDGTLIAGARSYGKTYADNRMLLSKMTATSFEPLLELPGNGSDCGYPGLVWHDGLLWVSYNSSHEGKTSVYLAKVRLPGVAAK